jgi:hypothetical protein
MKLARSALHISLPLRERAGVRETIMAHATYIFPGGAGAMIVSAILRDSETLCENSNSSFGSLHGNVSIIAVRSWTRSSLSKRFAKRFASRFPHQDYDRLH